MFFMIRVHKFTHFFTPKLVKVVFNVLKHFKQLPPLQNTLIKLKKHVFTSKTCFLNKKHVFYDSRS